MRMAISKRKPYGYQIAVDKNTSKSRFKLEFPQVTPFYAEPETLQSGVDRIDFGNAKMQIFDKDRLICECLKYEDKMERAVFQEGVLSYIKDEKKGYSKSDEIRQRTSCGEKSTIDDRGMALNGG